MNAGGYSDAEVDKCYIPDSHQLFDSYRNSDLYKYAGDEATTFAKIAFENEDRRRKMAERDMQLKPLEKSLPQTVPRGKASAR